VSGSSGRLHVRQALPTKNTIYQIKRFIGQRSDEPAVAKDRAAVPYEMRKSTNGGIE